MLGGLRVIFPDSAGGAVAEKFPTRHAASLLAYLAYFLNVSRSRDELATLLWPDADADAGRNLLKQNVSLLRRTFAAYPGGDALLPPVTSGRQRSLLRLGENVTTDVSEFEAALRTTKSANEAQALDRTIALYNGPLLPNIEAEWAAQERERLAALYVSALRRRAALYVHAGKMEEGIDLLYRGCAAAPLEESVHLDLMNALADSGRTGEALRKYRAFERRLHSALGVLPDVQMRRLSEEIEGRRGPSLSFEAAPLRAQDTAIAGEDALRLLGQLGLDRVTGRPELLAALRPVADQLTVSERAALRRRHTDHSAALLGEAEAQWSGVDATRYLDKIEAQTADFTAAIRFLSDKNAVEGLAFAARLHYFWYTRGRHREGRELLENLLRAVPAVKTVPNSAAGKARADALLASGHFANLMNDFAVAFARYREAGRLYFALGDREGMARTQMRMGNAAQEIGDFPEAQRQCARATAHFRKSDDPSLVTAMFLSYQTHHLVGDREQFNRELADALHLARAVHDGRTLSLLLYGIAEDALLHRFDTRAAVGALSEALEIQKRHHDPMVVIYLLNGVANVAAMRRSPEDAALILSASDALRVRHDLPKPPFDADEAYAAHQYAPALIPLLRPAARPVAQERGETLAASLSATVAFALEILNR